MPQERQPLIILLGHSIWAKLHEVIVDRIMARYPGEYSSRVDYMSKGWDDIREVLETNFDRTLASFSGRTDENLTEGNEEFLDSLADEARASEHRTREIQESRDIKMFR